MRCLCAFATLGSVASYVAAYALLRRWEGYGAAGVARVLGPWDALLAKNGVTSYISYVACNKVGNSL